MADVAASTPQRLSRYRSQRQQSQQLSADDTPAVPQAVSQDEVIGSDGLSRRTSQSRYRRRPSGSGGMRPATSGDQEHLSVGVRPISQRGSPAKPAFQTKPTYAPQSQRYSGAERGDDERQLTPPAQLGARRIRSQEMDWNGEDERRMRLTERYSQRYSDNPSSPMKPNSAAQTPTGNLFPPPRPEPVRPSPKPVLLDGPPTSDQIRATKSMSELPKYLDDDDEDASGCFGFFKRKRGEAVPQVPKISAPKQSDSREPATIRPGGGGVVPGIDAPISAVNAGDRRVLVECGKSKSVFPVTPTTTSVEIIKNASLRMSERIDPKSAVLLESFGSVGIQRPLRRYEPIRSVMNSWESDAQNSLILVDPGTGTSEAELSVAGVPHEKPGDETWFMSFSQKIGKWDKRLITLRSDGQVTMQKDPDRPKDLVNVCHLSDFDIYTPTQERVRKKIKPPKKYCFAVKSQQKTSMFESTHDFVHFFCTNDKQIADEFYTAIQGWRSWYLFNVMGEGRKPKSSDGANAEKDVESRGLYKSNHRPGKSMESQYQLGSFKPLITLDDFEKDSGAYKMQEERSFSGGFTKSSNQFDTTISPERRISRPARKQHPPGAMQNKAQLADDEPLANIARQGSINRRRPSLDQTKAPPEEFLSSGLLGRTYTQRQKEHAERKVGAVEPEPEPSPWTNGPSLLNAGYENAVEDHAPRRSLDGGPRRMHSTRGQQAHKTQASGDLQRSTSRAKEMPKPLVDLTPQYREPPQHLRKGRGYQADTLASGPLIDNATSPEDHLGIPPSTDWRGRNIKSSHGQSDSQSRIKPTQSIRRPATSRENSGGFTGEGLLAGSQAQSGWGGGERGRGVLDGSRAKGPMLDLTERSMFPQGSLLNRAEQERGPAVPVIDRTRDDDTAAW